MDNPLKCYVHCPECKSKLTRIVEYMSAEKKHLFTDALRETVVSTVEILVIGFVITG